MDMKKALLCVPLLAALCSTGTTRAMDRGEYVASVIKVLQTHVNLLEQLASGNRFKYSDNLVRHAIAVRDTFGMLGPMEWHAAQAHELQVDEEERQSELTERTFEALAMASQRSLKDLVRAAHDSMEQHDPAGVLEALTEMKNTCNSCHSLLPESVAPDVWGMIERD